MSGVRRDEKESNKGVGPSEKGLNKVLVGDEWEVPSRVYGERGLWKVFRTSVVTWGKGPTRVS